ncbi:hypothetical protein G6F60_015027 [Rhizopus arrhizus]|nr:hypothetical protein G6F60_015027 [Rhizopus arrhizus]
MVAPTAADAKAVQSQVKRVIRTIYSSPSTHGAALVAGVLTNPDLRAMWEQELTEMRERIHALRHGLVEKLAAAGAPQSNACATSSASTPSAPAASAWPR